MDNQKEQIKLFQNQLPINEYKKEIIKVILENDFVVITGDTGSGKSTQLPQYIIDSEQICEELNKRKQNSQIKQTETDTTSKQIQSQQQQQQQVESIEQTQEELIKNENKKEIKAEVNQNQKNQQIRIVITQPRRVAAISMAKRICYERSVKLSQEVGYAVRFDDCTTEKTILRYVTDGILVRECLQDRDLTRYNIVILDEAHERSLHTDILFALVKQAVIRRNGTLKLIITSATLDTDQFSNFFNKCPVLKMKGRSFPVEVKYGQTLANKRVDEAVKAVIRMHLHEGPGDILVFLTGSEECEIARRLCFQKLQELKNIGKSVPTMKIFTLYGAQRAEEQSQVFEKPEQNSRKLIFSTNIAETSLTIDGIGFVVDGGYVKQKCYNPRTGMDALIVVPISKVQAIQRQGRAGRTQPGKCFRLYSEKFYNEDMKEYTVPEILRVNLANVILDLKHMKIDDVMNFEYMERPDNDAILQALKQLYFLDAIDENGKITDLGNQMNRFPLEPSYSKALISSMLLGCQEEMITLVSILSSEQMWSKPPRIKEELYAEFEKNQKEFIDLDGDHHTLLKIYRRWVRSGFSDHFCKNNFLNGRGLKLAENIKDQVKDLVKKTDLQLCMNFYKNDPIYKIYKKLPKNDRDYLHRSKKHKQKQSQNQEQINEASEDENSEQTEITPSDLFRMSLTTGFFFNSARKLHNNENMYLLIYPEGNVVDVDQQSIYSLTEEFPPCVIFTELGGTSAIKGVIRLLSQVKYKWIEGYLSKTQNVDVFQLAGMQIDTKQILINRHKQQQETNLLNENEEQIRRDQKVNEQKERYLQRKKIKLN